MNTCAPGYLAGRKCTDRHQLLGDEVCFRFQSNRGPRVPVTSGCRTWCWRGTVHTAPAHPFQPRLRGCVSRHRGDSRLTFRHSEPPKASLPHVIYRHREHSKCAAEGTGDVWKYPQLLYKRVQPRSHLNCETEPPPTKSGFTAAAISRPYTSSRGAKGFT